MAYVTPPTRTTGTVITAAIWNQDVVANQQASAPDVFTTKGDLFVATAADAGARVAVGANFGPLIADSNQTEGVRWGNNSSDRYMHLANAHAWGMVSGALQAGENFIALGVKKSGANNSYIAETGDNAAVSHLVFEMDYVGSFRFFTQAHAADDATLSPTENMTINVGGEVGINHTGNNGFMSIGLTINQGANDNEILTLKSSDVAHGMTTNAETDTWFAAKKQDSTNGGAYASGYSAGTVAVKVGAYAVTDVTDKSSSATGYFMIEAGKKSGSSVTAPGANANLVVIRDALGIGKFIFDQDADFIQVGGGIHYINDDANAKMTVGITLNQGAADDEIVALKSSDVAHGITDWTETDTYAFLKKYSATDGGLALSGITEGGPAVFVYSYGTTDNTGKTTSALGYFNVEVGKKSGTGLTTPGANANMVVFRDALGSARFIFDNEGSAHADVEWIAFDAHDDVALLTGVEQALQDPVKGAFGKFMDANRKKLQKLKIAKFNPDGHHFINFTRLAMLHTGAIRQLAGRIDQLEARLLAA